VKFASKSAPRELPCFQKGIILLYLPFGKFRQECGGAAGQAAVWLTTFLKTLWIHF
jgi:hypothetical protein